MRSTTLMDSRVLVVDGSSLNRELIISHLQSAGFSKILTAFNGSEALKKVKEFAPHLLILDLAISEKSGIDVIRTLRGDAHTKHLPILVQTSISNPEQRAEVWNYGATDIISKPIHRLELLSRVKVHLQNAYLIEQLESYQQEAEQDITQALELQESLLPSREMIQEIEKREKLEIESVYIPCRFLSGDVWGLIDAGPGHIIVWICDFSGKGIRAALHTFQLHILIKEFKHLATNPSELMKRLNDKLAEVIPIGQFSTFMLGMIDLARDTFQYVTASSTHPIIYYPDRRHCEIGDGAGLPLGVAVDSYYPLKTLTFPKG
ncbi:MAG TPA: SpoIIE family protein phosphatase, partial [Candidatus Nitrosotenuis sp.]|nr:SpoIIE family protein phosphatase [Candidatus Nitrosotenuis sp.]